MANSARHSSRLVPRGVECDGEADCRSDHEARKGEGPDRILSSLGTKPISGLENELARSGLRGVRRTFHSSPKMIAKDWYSDLCVRSFLLSGGPQSNVRNCRAPINKGEKSFARQRGTRMIVIQKSKGTIANFCRQVRQRIDESSIRLRKSFFFEPVHSLIMAAPSMPGRPVP